MAISQILRPLIVTCLFLVVAGNRAEAYTACTLVKKIGDTEPLYQTGQECNSPYAPASTFKIPLALIGFDSGLLISPDEPAIPYDPAIKAYFKSWRQTTTPRYWLRKSVLWYSRWLTRQLGMARFKAYIDRFDYGNRDLSGTPGRNDGLTTAWLGTSLTITPTQQLAFLEAVVTGRIPVSKAALQQVKNTIPTYLADPVIEILAKPEPHGRGTKGAIGLIPSMAGLSAG